MNRKHKQYTESKINAQQVKFIVRLPVYIYRILAQGYRTWISNHNSKILRAVLCFYIYAQITIKISNLYVSDTWARGCEILFRDIMCARNNRSFDRRRRRRVNKQHLRWRFCKFIRVHIWDWLIFPDYFWEKLTQFKYMAQHDIFDNWSHQYEENNDR